MRRYAAALAFALSFGLLITGCDSEPAGPEVSNTTSEGVMTQQGPPGGGPQQLAQQLNTVRQATEKYRDLKTARADGYADISGYVPGMGFHFADEDGPFGKNLESPPVLVYFTNGSYNPNPGDSHDPAHDDDLILGAVEFLVSGDQTNNKPDIFNDEDNPRNLKVTEEHGWHYDDPPGLPDFTALHAWVHRGNPAGVFHPTNPNIE